jgi:hypothetical protein
MKGTSGQIRIVLSGARAYTPAAQTAAHMNHARLWVWVALHRVPLLPAGLLL